MTPRTRRDAPRRRDAVVTPRTRGDAGDDDAPAVFAWRPARLLGPPGAPPPPTRVYRYGIFADLLGADVDELRDALEPPAPLPVRRRLRDVKTPRVLSFPDGSFDASWDHDMEDDEDDEESEGAG